MSNNLPFEIQTEIIKRLPVKSLIQFRSVSKSWKSLIESVDFIVRYNAQQTQLQHLVIRYYDNFISVVDDDTFPLRKVHVTIPWCVKWYNFFWIVGCSNGLMGLYGYCREGCGGPNSRTGMAVIWNLSIRKAVAVVVPYVKNQMIYENVLGFGVCRETSDPKIVKITQINSLEATESITCIPSQVEVFTLTTKAWRNSYGNLPRKSIKFGDSKVVIEGVLYWLAIDRIKLDGEFVFYNLVISFDMTSEEFKEINLPDTLAHNHHNLHISNLLNSLVVLESHVYSNDPVSVVWMMKDGVPKSFTKLFAINFHTGHASLRGFRKSGAPIVALAEDGRLLLVVYEPYAKHIDDFWIHGGKYSFLVYPYVKSLLLLDQPDHIVYNDISKWKAKNKRLM
ncbi:hypothetical protein QVD17_06901 [Tagetes erecta]|uniref:F-box domain-containing protein n=1 Tax=Tagetes erecta TaxID=13708 RepID=A0AAD8PC67_TARER|nr:hypothetical protein QVD17_06901 [Tagetes erecta]